MIDVEKEGTMFRLLLAIALCLTMAATGANPWGLVEAYDVGCADCLAPVQTLS